MGRLMDVIKRYVNKNDSSLAFWWLPLYEGSGEYLWGDKKAGDYYLDFRSKAEYKLIFDKAGVMMLDYKGTLGVQYNPCAIAQYGLGLYGCYMSNKEEGLLRKMKVQANWLCDNVKAGEHGIGRLEYTYGGNEYDQISNKNYISAIAQGQAVSFLLRAGILLNNKRYLEKAECIYQCFRFEVQDGGVVNYDEQGRMYLEEALTKKVSCILDGFIYAMFGVYDYYSFTKDREALRIFENCCKTVKERLPEFDLGFWSRADCYLEKPKMPASFFYHNVHVQQLKALFALTGDEIFQEYAQKWENYQKNWLFRKLAFVYKCWFKVFYY